MHSKKWIVTNLVQCASICSNVSQATYQCCHHGRIIPTWTLRDTTSDPDPERYCNVRKHNKRQDKGKADASQKCQLLSLFACHVVHTGKRPTRAQGDGAESMPKEAILQWWLIAGVARVMKTSKIPVGRYPGDKWVPGQYGVLSFVANGWSDWSDTPTVICMRLMEILHTVNV